MAEEEPQQLAYVQETILKKRKSNDELAITRKRQLELGKYGTNKKRKLQVADIKRPEDFVTEFRKKEFDLIRMKRRAKKAPPKLKSQLLFIIRIMGTNDMHPKTKKILCSLKLNRTCSGVFAKATEGVIDMLQKVEPFVTYGYPNIKSIKDLIYKKGYAKIGKKPVPLTDNTVIEQALGKYGIICVEDIVHEVANIGAHFKEVMKFMGSFQLSKPEGGLPKNKQPYKDGGDAGNREDAINDLISKMT